MKKLLPLILLGFLISNAKAQTFPLQVVEQIPYYSSDNIHERVMIQDSSIYECRDGCVQILNVINGKTEYRWTNNYASKMLLPDHHGNYILLRNSSVIGVYDTTLHDYVNVNTGPLSTFYINSIGTSPNGNIWALSYQKLGIYNGTNWLSYPFNGYGRIKVINDTSAYIVGYPFLRFHNGVFDTLFSLPSNTYFNDWDVDSLGNLWIAGANKLIYAQDTTLTLFDSTNTPVGSEKFLKVVVGKNGHVWTCGEKGKLFEYDGTNWTTHALPSPYLYIDNFNLDSLSHPWVIAGSYVSSPFPQYSYMHTYVWNGSSFNSGINFPFMPYYNIKAIAPSALANDEGVFTFSPGYQTYRVNQFLGNPERPEAVDLNCFRTFTRSSSPYDMAFGTHSGIYTSTGTIAALDTSVLPSDSVNCILNDNGNDYVCTDQGLLIFNGVFYNYLDTSNSPIPSNKITFAIIAQDQPYNKLYLGTDNGIAIYSNNQWTVYDSTDLGLSSFYVTGILPGNYWDTVTYVSTMGSGLIKIYDSGAFEILNTSNGTFADDSLYYVMYAELGKCGEYLVIGTEEHGIATFDFWNNDFYYYNTSNGYPFNRSRAGLNNIYYGGNYLMGTDTGIYWVTGCGGIIEGDSPNNIKVYPNPSTGIFTIETSSRSKIEIHNIVGELIYETTTIDEKTRIDLSSRAKGMYFIRATDRSQNVINKKVIIH